MTIWLTFEKCVVVHDVYSVLQCVLPCVCCSVCVAVRVLQCVCCRVCAAGCYI